MNGRNRSSQSLSTSAECTPAASAHTQSRRSCASWAATLGWVEAGRLGASSWLQALGSPRPRRARETVTRRERPPRQSAVAVQARGGWAAQGVKKRCRLPPVVDGLSALPQRQLDLGGVFPARSARSPASPTRVAVESRSGAIPRAPRPRAGGWRWARRGGWSFSYGEKGYEGREPQVPGVASQHDYSAVSTPPTKLWGGPASRLGSGVGSVPRRVVARGLYSSGCCFPASELRRSRNDRLFHPPSSARDGD